MNQTTQTRWMILSERVYGTLLFLYPADYRREYCPLMAQFFRDASRDRLRRDGMAGVALWWCKTLLDLMITVIEQRRKPRFIMSRSTVIQLTGILLILGGACVALGAYSQLQPGSHYSYHGIYQLAVYLLLPGCWLIGIGTLGLSLQYAKAVGVGGQWALIVSGVGALLMGAGFVLTSFQEWFWLVAMIGLLAHGSALGVVGIKNLWARILPGFRGLPILAAVILVVMLTGVLNTGDGPLWGSFASVVVLGGIWMTLGVAAHRDQMHRPQARLENV